jgi:hypothetical protein
MTYRIVKYTPQALVTIETCDSFSEAEMKIDEIVQSFPDDWIEIVSDPDFQSCPTD